MQGVLAANPVRAARDLLAKLGFYVTEN